MREDDEAVLTAVVERQGRFAFRVAYSLLRQPEDAEDAVQEMFLKLYTRRAWRGLRDERAFVARATWRTALDKLRQRRAGWGQGEEAGSFKEIADRRPDPERSAMSQDWNEKVHAMIDRLPEDLRQPLALSTLELNSREIGEVMGIAEGTVRTRLMRARSLVREKLATMEKGQHARLGQ